MSSQSQPRGMSEAAIERIKRVEGFRAEPYADGKTGSSIGYGFHREAWPEKAKSVQWPITRKQAEDLLRYCDNENAKDFSGRLGAQEWNNLAQQQIDGILSACYNAGTSGVWRVMGGHLKNKDWEAAADALEKYATTGYQGAKKLDLHRRRKEDADIFRDGSQRSQQSVNMYAKLGLSGITTAVGYLVYCYITRNDNTNSEQVGEDGNADS